MSGVVRYAHGTRNHVMTPAEDGPFVRSADYDTLRAQFEAAGRAIADATVERGRAIARAEAAEAECGRLRDVPEGCTPQDADVLRVANHELAEECARLRTALEFYAEKEHFAISDPSEWDTVSGEPQQLWCDQAGTATVEDGGVAREALAARTKEETK